MTNLSLSEVEDWLDANPESVADYFIRKADIDLINRWLMAHGFLTIRDYVSSRRGSTTLNNSEEDSPVEKNSGYFSDGGDAANKRNSSKKALRQDFARSKARTVFKRNEPLSQSADTHTRRNSLKDMRKFLSLPSRSIHILNLLIESKIRLPRLPSRCMESKRELRDTNERQFFLEIVEEIAHDLDVKSLSQKIIVNLCVLLDSDRASLFLVEGPKSHQCLVSKVFDVHCGTSLLLPSVTDDSEIKVPWGKGIIGYVAETGETVNLIEASEDPRYDDEVDRIRGYSTNTLLCMPIRNADDEIIAVAQVINKSPMSGCNRFVEEDEKLFQTYLQFCGIALTNAQIFDLSRKEYERNRSLLEVVHDLFEEQTSLEKVILKIMQRAQKLLKCERAAVLLLREDTDDDIVKFSRTFDLTSPSQGNHVTNFGSKRWPELQTSSGLLKIAERVALSGEVLNLTDPPEVQQTAGRHISSLLCMPIRNRENKIIGVSTIINRSDGMPFDDYDEQLFEAFTIFCGLGINNTLMYSELDRAMARQKVAFEVISYHATACQDDVNKILAATIPEMEELNLNSLKFDDFSLNSEQMILASIRIFSELGLISRFNIDYEALCMFLCTVRKNYRNLPYHNWRHAFNVCQVMFAIFTKCNLKTIFSDFEMLGMIVGCLCHDLDHRGTNNSFQEKSGSALALLYGNKGTMEHHHFNHAVMILTSQNKNIFSSLSSEKYSIVMNILKQAILATDLSTYFQSRTKFFSLVDNSEFDWSDEDHRALVRNMLMTACDLAASTKPWQVQYKIAELVTSEFFDQGDKEKMQLKIQPQALMDREKKHELPQLQYRWIDTICLPLYRALSKINPRFMEMVDGAVANREMWAAIAAQNISESRPKLTNGTSEVYIKETGV
ncbi:dual 3',5'-cyclic-AMP and -GMP phosphodiesterase 11A-like [Centruroides vittatus]|uniref:dual 3',5'-cyclic-AMP and -GMP phosphodiesterase 11A-like n=1 Tax=Centruroides vittatus TaxID=120091 RepID=UPI00350F6F91